MDSQYGISLQNIVGRKSGKKGKVNPWKNYGGSVPNYESFMSANPNETAGALSKIFDYLQKSGANPRWGPKGQILATNPLKPGKLTTSIRNLREWTANTAWWYDPVWMYAYNASKAGKSLRTVQKMYSRFGDDINALGAYKDRQSMLRYYRKGRKFAMNPSILDAKANQYINAANKATRAFQQRFNSLDARNRKMASDFSSMFGNSNNMAYAPPRNMYNPYYNKSGNSTMIIPSDGNSTMILEDLNF